MRFIDPDGMFGIETVGGEAYRNYLSNTSSSLIGNSPTDWVMDGNNKPYWDNNATSQSTTKAGETYLGKNVRYETKGGYDITLSANKTWHYTGSDMSDKTSVGSRFSDFQAALGSMQTALKTAEVTGE